MRWDIRSAPFAAIAACAALAIGLSILFLPIQSRATAFSDRVAILVEESVPAADVLAALDAAAVRPVLCAANQPVELTDFVSRTTVSLAECMARLVPGDPRLDPFIRGLLEYYVADRSGKRYAVYFVKANQSAAASSALQPWKGLWTTDAPAIVTFSFYWMAVLATVPCAVALFIVFAHRRGRLRRVVLALPWVPFWLHPSASLVAAGLCAWYAAVNASDLAAPYRGPFVAGPVPIPRTEQRAFIHALVRGALPFGIAAIAIMAVTLAPLPFACAIVATIALWLVWARIDAAISARRRVHALFAPVPIDFRRFKRTWPYSFKVAEPWISAACIVVMSLSFVPSLVSGPSPVGTASASIRSDAQSYATPRIVDMLSLPRSGTDVTAAITDRRDNPTDSLVNLADFIAHRAYQDALAKGRYGTAVYGVLDPVTLIRYDVSVVPPVSRTETVMAFDAAWIGAGVHAARDERVSGIVAVGMAGGRYASLSKTGQSMSGPKSYLEPADFIVYIIVLVPLVGLMPLRRKERTVLSVPLTELRQEA